MTRRSWNLRCPALKWRMIESNPLADIKSGSHSNTERQHYFSQEDIARLIEQCPTREWRCIFAMARYAGVRVPSEVWDLGWADINWETGMILVRSPKTAGYAGKDTRSVPMMPELRDVLRTAFEEAEEGASYVCPSVRLKSNNFCTQGARIIERAGLKVWPKPFVNCRSSCATDMGERFPIKTAAEWLGHSPTIALAHYHRSRADVHALTLIRGGLSPAESALPNTIPERVTESGTIVSRKASLSAADTNGPERRGGSETPENKAVYPPLAATVHSRQNHPMTPWGSEPLLPG